MIYSRFNFITGTLCETVFDSSVNADHLRDRDNECIVMKASSKEDECYVGTGWQCMHCIPATSCIVCNPAYRTAVITDCSKHVGKSWHVNDECLKCRYEGVSL